VEHSSDTCDVPQDMNKPLASPVPPPTLDLFKSVVPLTENMNTLKKHLNAKKCSRCKNPSHLDLVSSDKEELPVPIVSVLVLLLTDAPLTSDTIVGLTSNSPLPIAPATHDSGPINMHIPTLLAVLAPGTMPGPSQPVAPPSGLSLATWSALIAKAQVGTFP